MSPPPSTPALARFLDAIERAGNRLPDPAVLFALLLGLVAVVSAWLSTMEFAELDPRIQAAAEHWRLARMAVIDRLILRIATYELRHEPDTPAAVVINEALELARTFSGDDAVRFVNGVLDAVARELRAGPA